MEAEDYASLESMKNQVKAIEAKPYKTNPVTSSISNTHKTKPAPHLRRLAPCHTSHESRVRSECRRCGAGTRHTDQFRSGRCCDRCIGSPRCRRRRSSRGRTNTRSSDARNSGLVDSHCNTWRSATGWRYGAWRGMRKCHGATQYADVEKEKWRRERLKSSVLCRVTALCRHWEISEFHEAA